MLFLNKIKLSTLALPGIRNYQQQMIELWRTILLKFTRELESSDTDSKTHFGTHMIKPNFCQHNAGRYILNKMWTVFVVHITINNDQKLFRAPKTFVNTSLDSENCSSRNRHENTFLSQTEQNEFLSTHSAPYILDNKRDLFQFTQSQITNSEVFRTSKIIKNSSVSSENRFFQIPHENIN